jgi:hypothetical protein
MQYLATEIEHQLTQIKTNQETIDKLEKNKAWIQFGTCDKKLCAKIETNSVIYEDGYRVLKKK